jgi:hypothetical protein
MTLFKSIVTVLSFGIISSCATKKDSEKSSLEETKMLESGFSKASMVESKIEGDCPYTIQLSEGGVFLDPINLDDAYKKQGEKIWVKYRGLRRMNRCDKANPVEIEEIQKRTE